MLTAAMAAAMRKSGTADAGEWCAQVTVPRIASAATSSRLPATESTPRAIAMASRTPIAFRRRGGGLTWLTVSRPGG
jgi:hypothetical protein